METQHMICRSQYKTTLPKFSLTCSQAKVRFPAEAALSSHSSLILYTQGYCASEYRIPAKSGRFSLFSLYFSQPPISVTHTEPCPLATFQLQHKGLHNSSYNSSDIHRDPTYRYWVLEKPKCYIQFMQRGLKSYTPSVI